MAISFSCSCGKKINAKDEHAGKKGKCPQCGGMITVPMLAAAGAASRSAAKPRSAAPPPIDEDMYDVREDEAPPRTYDEGIGLGDAITPMPYNPVNRPAAAPAAGRGAAVPGPGAPQFPGAIPRRGAVQEKQTGLAGITSKFQVSGYMLFLIAAVIIVPIGIWVIKAGPVTAVAEWDKAETDGENDVRSTMNYIIVKMDEATKPPPDPNADLSGIPYNPEVKKFLFKDPPSVMWRMPDQINFEGHTTFGEYSGTYWTRKREIEGTMEWKGKTLNVVSKCDDEGNIASLTVDGVDINNAAEVKKKFGGSVWDDF